MFLGNSSIENPVYAIVNMSNDSESLIEENFIQIKVVKNHDNPGKCKTFYNPVMKICREFVLAALGAYCSECVTPVKCLDAFGATGIGGLQWKHHLTDAVDVTINELDGKSVQAIRNNCLRNGINTHISAEPCVKDIETKATDHSLDMASTNATSQLWDKMSTDNTSQPLVKMSTDNTSQPLDKMSTDTTSQPLDKMSTDTTSQPLDKMSTDTTSQPLDKMSIDTTSQSLDKISTDTTSQPLDKMSIDTTSQPLDKMSIDTTNQPLDKMSTDTTSQPLDKMSTDTTSQSLDKMSTDTVSQPLDKMSTDITSQPMDKMSTDMPTVEVVHGDANVIMHTRSFHFIHLDPYGTTVQFLDAAFRNIYNKGLLVLTSTDVASLYGKCPQVTLRNYGAHTATTDYVKETAVRLLIAEAVRSAAKCNKGIEVVYGIAVEHFVQVALLIKRGAKHADTCMQQIRTILHCQCCGEWAMYPNSRTVIGDVYSYLSCDCHQASGSSNAALHLGPMWCGEIYRTHFLQKMFTKASEQKLSERIRLLLSQLICESECAYASYSQHIEQPAVVSVTDGCNGCGVKRQAADAGDRSKRLKGMREYSDSEMPMFYYNVHRRKVKGVDLPKVAKLVKLLQEEQFRASRTHFDTNSIRTNATLAQLLHLLHTHCKTKGTRKSLHTQTNCKQTN